MGRLGAGEILVIVLIFVILFGAKKLPDLGQAIGKALREFRKASKEVGDDVKETLKDEKDG
jgi:sec-independent protein translocase protein TatA